MTDKKKETLRESLTKTLTERYFGGSDGTGGLWESARAERMKELRGRLQDSNNPFSLVVGSGLTASVGLPAWSALLGRLEVDAFDMRSGKSPDYDDPPYPSCDYPFYDFPEFRTVKTFQDARDYFGVTDPLELAEYIKVSLPGGSRWETEKQALMKTIVRKALEADPKYLNPDDKKNQNSYLSWAARLCASRFRSNNRYIVTFNYDNLLEWYIEKRSGLPYPNAVYDRNPAATGMNVYHIHGYLGLEGTGYEKDESERIILTEDDYLDLERNPYCWENYLLTRALHEGDSLFLGFSGDDFNFRRILRGLSQPVGKIKRYMVVSVGSIVKSVVDMAMSEFAGKVPPRDYMVRILSHWLEIRDVYWSKKGFVPIWATREQCPKLIESLIP